MPEDKESTPKPQQEKGRPQDPGDILKKGKTPKDWEERLGRDIKKGN